MAEKYLLQVTAGHSYDPTTHKIVNVNSPTAIHIEGSEMSISLNVRVQNYRGNDTPELYLN